MAMNGSEHIKPPVTDEEKARLLIRHIQAQYQEFTITPALGGWVAALAGSPVFVTQTSAALETQLEGWRMGTRASTNGSVSDPEFYAHRADVLRAALTSAGSTGPS